MKKTVIGLIALGFIALYLLIDSPADKKKKAGELTLPEVESNELRNYKVSLKLIKQFDFLDGQGIFRMFSDGSNIWVIDNQQEVSKISDYGDEIETRLVRFGGAPFENSQLASIKSQDDKFYMVDIEKNTVRIQEADNVEKYQKLITPIYNGVSISKEKFLTISDFGPESSFQLIDINIDGTVWNKKLTSVFDLPATEFPEIVTEGVFTYNQDGKTFYVPGRMGQFICFDDEGEIDYLAETIDKTEAPRAYTKPILKGFEAKMFVREPDFYVNYSCSADSKFLYILSKYKTNKRDDFMTVDAYEAVNGKYNFSFPIPNIGDLLPVEIAALDNNKIFVLYENHRVAYFDIELL